MTLLTSIHNPGTRDVTHEMEGPHGCATTMWWPDKGWKILGKDLEVVLDNEGNCIITPFESEAVRWCMQGRLPAIGGCHRSMPSFDVVVLDAVTGKQRLFVDGKEKANAKPIRL